MTFVDFFAGIGGFRKGLELAGHQCVGFCESDSYAVMSYTAMHLCTNEQLQYLNTLPKRQRQEEILKEEYRNGEWYAEDITRICANDIPKADIWCAGFPCQDISLAGKKAGFQGERSWLFFRVMQLCHDSTKDNKPAYLLFENVTNLLDINGGWDFARMLSEMDRNGYDAEWSILGTQYFKIPQNRDRLFVVGHLRGKPTARVFPLTVQFETT